MKWKILDLIIVFLLFIIIFFIIQNYYSKEGFTSRIREMYRPYFRRARLFKEKSYNQLKNNFFSFIRKFGLI
jgi:hypothetical protein